MPAFSSPSSSPPPTASRRRLRNCAHRIERLCCALATYFPLAFVYSLTTWAVWVEAGIGLGTPNPDNASTGASVRATSIIGVIFYLLLNASYTTAVFTDPGSPLNGPPSKSRGGSKYTVLPTSEPSSDDVATDIQTVTVSSSGQARFCKKCQTSKPDRTHHCSTCKRCVLKMDHHCPWLATCLGHRNYKCFVLFLVYTTLFCYACFASSGQWVWQFFSDSKYLAEEYASVNVIMLAVISGLIGVVLTGFTGWHLWLCCKGMTTIECLEKTRYLKGVRGRVERNRIEHNRRGSHGKGDNDELMDRVRRAGDQILEFHANAIPGASRYEEGEERMSPSPSYAQPLSQQDEESAPLYHDHPPNPNTAETPAIRALRASYNNSQPPRGPPGRFNYRLGVHEYETSREQQRYNEYMEDREDEKLPNAFDLGWRRNLIAVFGEKSWAWFLPICNSPGDGWRWEVSETWRLKTEEADRIRSERLLAQQQEQQQQRQQGHLANGHGHSYSQGYDGAYDQEYPQQYADHYSRSATSLSTLTPQGRASIRSRDPRASVAQRGRAWGGRYRKDVDRSGEDGEAGEFEVSGDSADEDDGEDGDVYDERHPMGGDQRADERLARQGSWERDWD